jgi:hypothetical protein
MHFFFPRSAWANLKKTFFSEARVWEDILFCAIGISNLFALIIITWQDPPALATFIWSVFVSFFGAIKPSRLLMLLGLGRRPTSSIPRPFRRCAAAFEARPTRHGGPWPWICHSTCSLTWVDDEIATRQRVARTLPTGANASRPPRRVHARTGTLKFTTRSATRFESVTRSYFTHR